MDLQGRGTLAAAAMNQQRGFVAIEFLLAVVLLLIPIVLIVAGVQVWIERRYVATVVARDAAVHASNYFPAKTDAGEQVAEVVAATYGVNAKDIKVEISSDDARGRQVRAEVTIKMPAIVVPFAGSFGRWYLTTDYTVRIDDYRSRTP